MIGAAGLVADLDTLSYSVTTTQLIALGPAHVDEIASFQVGTRIAPRSPGRWRPAACARPTRAAISVLAYSVPRTRWR